MTDFNRLTDAFSAAPQLTPDDVARAGRDGYAMIVNNRPDGEEPGQPGADEIEAAAREAGLGYVFIPVTPGQVTPDMVESMGAALDRAGGPVLAYCRSGARSAMLWALSQAGSGRMSPEEIDRSARAGGYDISPLRPQLEALSGGG